MHKNSFSVDSADFSWITSNAKTLEAVSGAILGGLRAYYEAIKKIPNEKRTFANTIEAIERAGNEATLWGMRLELLVNVLPNPKTRQAALKAKNTLEQGLVDLEYEIDVYPAIKSYAALRKKTRERLALDQEKLFVDMVRSYRRMGFELPVKKRTELRKIIGKLIELCNVFHKNLNEYDDATEVSREELAGLSESYIAGLSRTKAGKYRVSLAYPDLVPFLEHAQNAKRRRELADKNAAKGGRKNLALAKQILALREKKAKVLGYPTHAAYRIEEKMAKTPERALRFIQDIIHRTEPFLRQDIVALTSLKRTTEGDPNAKLAYYDIAYYSTLLKQKQYNIDTTKLAEYFPLARVKDEIFHTYQTLFSVKFRKISNIPVWHPDVECFEVLDKHGKLLGRFFLDLYPRKGKFGHACANTLAVSHLNSDGVRMPTAAALLMNFPKGSAKHPACLSHREVETFFHEFGHCMHNNLSNTRYASQAGTSVKRDFVEAPSQIFENWAWEPKVLARMARHIQTDTALPKKDLQNLLNSRHHLAGYDVNRQTLLAMHDILLHTGKIKGPMHRAYAALSKKILHIEPSPKTLFPASLGHFAGGYDAGYYGYLWSLVYASDMFSRFAREEGIMSPRTGGEYRREILAVGASREEETSLRAFLKREPNNKAFLKNIGLGIKDT
ncbi:MAG: M3 family metallopeptidase [Minisyncoccota bacterium]